MNRALLSLVLICVTSQAQAWDKHATLMPWVLTGLPSGIRAKLDEPIKAPCADEDRKTYAELRKELLLNPNLDLEQMHLKPTAENCKKPTSGGEILARGFVNDPDQGMDKDLPDSMAAEVDPANDRPWMGGKTGPSSQGFRHMYFGGWKLRHPIETFQIPTHAIGQAPARAQLMADEARKLFASGQTAWAWRVISWELHYLQDLAQPFHSIQVPNLEMLPFGTLLSNLGSFGVFVKDTTRIITNYHWAYEGLVLSELELGERSPLNECLKAFDHEANLVLPEKFSEKDDALAVAHASVEIGGAFGHEIIGAFGTHLKDPASDLTQDLGTPNYAAMAASSAPEIVALNRMSCHAVSNAILVSRRIIGEASLLQKE